MIARKQKTNTRETNDDVYIEEFAKDFFGTNQPQNESLLSEKIEVSQKDTNKEKRKNNETNSQKLHNSDKEHNERKTREQNKREGQRKAPKNNNSPHSSPSLHHKDSRQSMIERFLELKEEFLSLSERLHDARMPKVSKKLTQVLTERQRLVRLLLDMNAPLSSDQSPENDWFQEEARSGNGVSEEGFEIPKKAKMVHWSDEHLGGSIIQDPSVYDQPSYPNSTKMQAPEPTYDKNDTKPPPRYKIVDNLTLTRRGGESQRNTRRDLNRCHCNLGAVNHEIEYVKEILNEAAELRREACCMLWRANYLEQLCDADGLVKHGYRSTSNAPTLPRYPRHYK